MCGIVGMINKLKHGFLDKQLAIFENLLYIDAMRGDDSTGAFVVNNLGNVFMAKDSDESTYFLKTHEWRTLRGKAFNNGWAVIGHNRKATRGAITAENAHPFWVDDKIVLVHNGSLTGDHRKLADVEVDSNAIAHVLAKEPDPEKALQQIEGAYALIWYDVENKKMNIIRNKERPLFWIETDDAFYFASESAMLYLALWRHGAKVTSKDGLATMFPEHELNSFGIDGTITQEALDCAPKEVEQRAAWSQAIRDSMEACGDSCEIYVDNRDVHGIEPGDEVKTVPYNDWIALRDSAYNHGRMVKVLVNDYHWEMGMPGSKVFLKGHTMDEHRSFVLIQVDHKEVRNLAQIVRDGDAMFNIQVNTCAWTAKRDGTGEGTIRILANKYVPLLEQQHAPH